MYSECTITKCQKYLGLLVKKWLIIYMNLTIIPPKQYKTDRTLKLVQVQEINIVDVFMQFLS